MADVSPLYAATRRALLDALDALATQHDGLVLVGAQAIFLHTGDVDEAIATETKDADLALDPAALHESPLLETAMTSAGFHLDLTSPQPGSWISRTGVPVDLLLPDAVSGRSGTGRTGRIPPHDKMSARRVLGIEGALVDRSEMRIAALTSDDVRAHTLKVAGPAALLVAKQYKIFERLAQPARQRPRDSHDVYRLLREVEPEVFTAGFELMLGNEISAAVAREAIGHSGRCSVSPEGQEPSRRPRPSLRWSRCRRSSRSAALRSLARCFPRSPRRGRPLARASPGSHPVAPLARNPPTSS